ncbi:MAG: hypothetical protein FWG34_13820 [Oscillospiraceae bacterium]|nr:hypothetical protein [Oscillospiraceae bacterium]
MSADIRLAKPKIVDELSVTDNGIKRINVFLADGSAFLSYNVEILRPTLLESDNRLYNRIHYFISGNARYKNGSTAGFGTSMSSNFGYPELPEFGEARIYNAEREIFDKITIKKIEVSVSTHQMPEFIYTLPLPELGGRIEFETPYYLDTIGEFEIYLDAIEYKGGELFIELAKDGIKYNGFEEVYDIRIGFCAADDDEYFIFGNYIRRHKIPIGYLEADTVDIKLTGLFYRINGLWETNFE